MATRYMIQAVLFDMDGVLVHSYHAWFETVRAAASEWGYPTIDLARFDSIWGQGVEADAENLFPGKRVPEIIDFYDRTFPAHLAHIRVEEGAVEIFHQLRALGVKSAVVTNTPRELAGTVLAHACLSPDQIVGGDDVAAAKPAPDIVLEACSRLGTVPARAVMLGDTRYDREAAHAAGASFAPFRLEAAPPPGKQEWPLARLEDLPALLAQLADRV